MKLQTRVVATAAVLILVVACGQVRSFKLIKGPQVQQQQDQEQQLRLEQLEQQRHFEALQREQQQAEYQIQQQQLEAQRLLGRPLPVQRLEAPAGVKGAAPALAFEQRQPYLPPQSTIAYLLVRPPYQVPLNYDETFRGAYAAQQPPARPLESYAAKGARQQAEEPAPQIEQQQQIEEQHQSVQQQPPQQPPQPALVVPVLGDKHGKLRALLDKIMSKLTLGSTYSVASEEFAYPQLQQQVQAQVAAKQEAPIVQQQIEQAPISQQEQLREEEPIVQQQQVQEQERDQGFGEQPAQPAQQAIKTTRLEPAKAPELARQAKEEPQVQQLAQEQELIRQPLAPIKGQQQQPLRQPEPIQLQRQEELATKSRRVVHLQPQHQQQFPQQQEQVRFESSKNY